MRLPGAHGPLSFRSVEESVARQGRHAVSTGSGAPAGVGSLEQAIGRQVRRLRGRLGLPAADIAASAGISTGMFSKIERGMVSASLATLKALAEALNTSPSALLAAAEERSDCSFVRAGEGVVIRRRGTKAGHEYRLLGDQLSGEVAVEPYLITLSPGARPFTGFSHAGVELIHMLTGQVLYRHADRSYPLSSGDTLFFDATASHGPEELTELPMTYLSIIIYPRV